MGIFYCYVGLPEGNWWFGALWFGFLGSPKMKGVPRLDPKPPTETTKITISWKYKVIQYFATISYMCILRILCQFWGEKTLPLLSYTISRVTSAEVEIHGFERNPWHLNRMDEPKINPLGQGQSLEGVEVVMQKNTTFFGVSQIRTPNEPTMNLRQRQVPGSVHHSPS